MGLASIIACLCKLRTPLEEAALLRLRVELLVGLRCTRSMHMHSAQHVEGGDTENAQIAACFQPGTAARMMWVPWMMVALCVSLVPSGAAADAQRG
jgi:hypothetical protein